MRRFRDPSSVPLIRRACVGPLPWTIQKRGILETYPSGVILDKNRKPTKSKFPTFELPDIVLDLNDEDSPYARPFTSRDADQQEEKWGANADADELSVRVGKLRKDIARDDKVMHHQASRPNTLQSISDYDVLAVALLGGGAVSSSLKNFRLRDEQSQRFRPITLSSLRTNGIPERILAGDANKVIPFMLHRQQLARTTEDAGGVEALLLTMRHFKNLSQLRKLCSGRTKVSEQIWTSSASIDHIVHILRSMPPQPLEDVLKFVNNFTIRQLTQNIELNASMSLYGLEIASKLNLLSPIVQYLQICLSQGFIHDDNTGTEILEKAGRGILVALEWGQGRARGTRPELFTILTGQSLASSAPQPALYGLDRIQRPEDARVHLIYVRLLAELGALRLLWHAWRQDPEAVGTIPFVRCAQVLSSAAGDASVDYATVTGDLEKDAYLDLWAIDNLDAYHTSVTSAKPWYSSNAEGGILPSEVKQAFFESADIHQVMSRLGELISRVAVIIQSDAVPQLE